MLTFSRRLTWRVYNVTHHLPTTSQSMAENVAFTFDLPYPMLKALNDFLDKPENEGEEEEEHVDGKLM